MGNGIWDKVRVATLGKINGLLDQVANTPEAYKQRIRDLESALADLRSAGDEQRANVSGYQREITQLTSDKAHKQADIDLLLGDNDPSNDDAALQMQMDLGNFDSQIATQQELLAAAQANSTDIQGAVDKLDHKHTEMVNELNKLTVESAAASAKNRAASAAEAASQASEAADGASVDSIEAKINHDSDVADARFSRVIGGLQSSSSPEEAANLARAKAALEARRAQITGQAVNQTTAPAPATA